MRVGSATDLGAERVEVFSKSALATKGIMRWDALVLYGYIVSWGYFVVMTKMRVTRVKLAR